MASALNQKIKRILDIWQGSEGVMTVVACQKDKEQQKMASAPNQKNQRILDIWQGGEGVVTVMAYCTILALAPKPSPGKPQ